MAVKNLFLKDFFLDEITFHFCRHWLSLGGKTRYQCLFATKLNSSSARLISIKNRFSQSLQMMSQFTILWWPFLTLAFGQKKNIHTQENTKSFAVVKLISNGLCAPGPDSCGRRKWISWVGPLPTILYSVQMPALCCFSNVKLQYQIAIYRAITCLPKCNVVVRGPHTALESMWPHTTGISEQL